MPYLRSARVRSRFVVGFVLTVALSTGVAGLWAPAGAAGTAYFVAPTGADTNSGTSASTPFKTIQKALDKAQPGTTITLAAGSYQEAVATKVAGTAGAPITIKGPESGKAVGGRYKATLYSPAGRVVSINHSYYTLDGFTIDGQPRIARTEYPTTLDEVRGFKDSVQSRVVNSKLVYVGAADTSRDITGTTISNMFLNGSGGECVRFRNRATNSLVVGSVIQWCGMLGQGDDKEQYKYHNAEGVYVGTSPKSTTQPLYANDTSNGIVVRDSTVNTFGAECFRVKENAHSNRIENSECGFNDEPLAFQGSNIELRGDHNTVLSTRLSGSRSWNLKLASDSPTYDRGGNTAQRSTFGGAAAAAIVNRQTGSGPFCANTFAGTVSEGNSVGNPTAACPDTTSPTAPTGLTARAASATSVALTWTAATDDVGVTGYVVRRGTVQIATPTATSYSDSGLAASTRYDYAVLARDAAGNLSPAATASVTTSAAPPPTTTTAPPTTAPPTTTPPTTAPPVAAPAIVTEAEAGAVSSPMAVRTDSAAQGGKYVSQTSGSSAGKVTLQVRVPTAGRYAVALRVIAPNSSSDSFVVKVGAASATTWNLGTRSSWTWVTGSTVAQLPAGTTTIVVTNREAGARLDAVRLTPAP